MSNQESEWTFQVVADLPRLPDMTTSDLEDYVRRAREAMDVPQWVKTLELEILSTGGTRGSGERLNTKVRVHDLMYGFFRNNLGQCINEFESKLHAALDEQQLYWMSGQ